MLREYSAILDGDQVKWTGESPRAGRPVHVKITVEESAEEPSAQGRAMAEAARRVAELNPFADIEDPVAWQREMRKDRPLPFRDE